MGRALLFPRAGLVSANLAHFFLPTSFLALLFPRKEPDKTAHRLWPSFRPNFLFAMVISLPSLTNAALFKPSLACALAFALLAFPTQAEKTASDAPPFRDTTTGKDFEDLMKAALEKEGYQVSEQTQVGTRPNGRKHRIDLVVRLGDRSVLVSLKWQQTSGTAEQKVPYEVICLSEALKQSRGKHQAAYLILGGDGWSLKEFYLNGGLDRHLSLDQPVQIMSPESFLKLSQTKRL